LLTEKNEFNHRINLLEEQVSAAEELVKKTQLLAEEESKELVAKRE